MSDGEVARRRPGPETEEQAWLRQRGERFARLVHIMARLRGPDGCPWDREQDFRSLRRYTLEEAYEVVDAIDRGEPAALADELGDLLLQVVFLAQMAREAGDFDVGDVADAISDKLVRRHPHVFGEVQVEGADDVVRNWEAIKQKERGSGSLLQDVPRGLPALERAQKLGKRAAQMHFDWSDVAPVLQKVHEELAELEQAMAAADTTRVEEELGDLLFAVANLARHLRLGAEVALTGANAKFERRFRSLEVAVQRGEVEPDADSMEAYWGIIKAEERRVAARLLGRDDVAGTEPD